MGNGHAALRKGRHSIGGQIYLITFTTAGRQKHFSDWGLASAASRLMTQSSVWDHSKLIAWILMLDHWHGLLELGDGASLSECVRNLKGTAAREVRRIRPDLGRIWASGFHDHAIRREENLRLAARYIVMNSVRAGLVGRIGDYPFWDAVWLDQGSS